MEAILRHKQKLLILLGTSVIAAAGYFALKKGKRIFRLKKERRDQSSAKQNTDQNESFPSSSEVPNIEKESGLIVEIKKENGYLTKQSVSNLYNAVITELMNYKGKMLKKHRSERRQIFDKPDECVSLFREYDQQCKNLYKIISAKVFAMNGVTTEEYEDSFKYYISIGDQELLRQANLGKMRSHKMESRSLTRSQIIEAVRCQGENVLIEASKIFSPSSIPLIKIQGSQFAQALLSARLGDVVFLKYGYEDEDIAESALAQNMNQDLEVASLFRQVSVKYSEALQAYGIN
eukprot:TRINITY_DN7859_c0_g1_i1.p1 TRINITY_DN7859_c0_g1~~TRINITY_DN7859_c0_g1_i1.p1  ORF type:complete len:291 (-),score=42.15 TRINITY_DN7859_c0_g1_i1:152-1024(-)